MAGYTVQFTVARTLAKAHGAQRLDEKLPALAEKPKLQMSMSSTTCRYCAAHVLPVHQPPRTGAILIHRTAA